MKHRPGDDGEEAQKQRGDDTSIAQFDITFDFKMVIQNKIMKLIQFKM